MKEHLHSIDSVRLLSKWLTPLFWLQIAQFLLGYLSKDTVLAILPWCKYPAYILLALCGLGISFCLWMSAPACSRYQKAAVFTGLGVFMDSVVHFSDNTYVDAMVGYPAIIVATFGIFLTYTAHASVLDDRDTGLASRFRELWKYTLITITGMFLSPFIARASGIFALLLLLACTIGHIIATIAAIVTLRQMLRILERDSMVR